MSKSQEIDRKEFLDVLNMVRSGLSSQEVLEQSNAFVFADNQVITFNDEIAVHHPIDFDIEGAVVAKGLLDLLSRWKGSTIEIEQTDSEILLKCGRGNAGLTLDAEIQLPTEEIKIPAPDDWEDLPSNFSTCLKYAAEAASRDASTPLLACVHIKGTQVESCDNFRATRCDLKEPMELFDELLIPETTARELSKIDFVAYYVTDGWFHAITEEETIYSCRTVEGEYIDLAAFFAGKGSRFALPEDIGEVVERAKIFSTDGTRSLISVTLKKGLAILGGESDSGWYSEEVKVKYKGEETSFNIAPVHLSDITKSTTKAVMVDNVLRFKTSKFTHVIAVGA